MFNKSKHTQTTPGGNRPVIYSDMSKQTHLLIAGKTGSGKSVVINGIIYSLLTDNFPGDVQFIFVDPKRVELSCYKAIPHCIYYASEQGQPETALQIALNIIENRYKTMQRNGQKKYNGGTVYIIIDELADLMTTAKKQILPLLQRIAQIGRAANVHIIAATQCPLTVIIPTELKVNFDNIVGLKTATAQHSRNIISQTGCDTLPPYGYGYYITPAGLTLEKLPMIPENEIQRVVNHWTKRKKTA